MNRDTLKQQLRIDEDVRVKPYVDTAGKITIGVGHNLSDKGLSLPMIDELLDLDINEALIMLDRAIPWWRDRPENVQQVLANLMFNLGSARFAGFKKTIKLLELKQYKSASVELLNSTWAKQVGSRAIRLAQLLRSSV